MLADLHIHSTCSDGTLSPGQIVARAAENGVTLLAVCDHNAVEGALAAQSPARAAGLTLLPGVELDSMLLGMDVHILCYGADLGDARLLAVVRHARERLDWMSDELLRRMLPNEPRLSLEEYARRSHEPGRGGWKLLQYLTDAGVTGSLREGFRFYDEYGVGYEAAGFRPAGDVIDAIHAAGGCAILAHPGVTFPGGSEAVFRGLKAALEQGADGVECFYPRHSPALTQALFAFCEARGLSATAGSDCHGDFGSAKIGQTRTPTDALLLRHPAFHQTIRRT